MRLLLAEDDPRMAALLRRGLSEEGHVVDIVDSGAKAIDLARAADFDVWILDVGLPDGDGFGVVRRLRACGHRTPALMLTARDANADIIAGLEAGADDYLTKPFAFDVLMARLHALARRGPAVHDVWLHVADLSLNPATRVVTRAQRPVHLSRTEFALLEHLMRRAGRVVTRQVLIDGVWGVERDVEDNTLDAFVRLLRQKVDDQQAFPLIHTVRGVGYCLRSEP